MKSELLRRQDLTIDKGKHSKSSRFSLENYLSEMKVDIWGISSVGLEHRICIPRVVSSSLTCSSFKIHFGIVQGLAYWAHNPEVVGSNPTPENMVLSTSGLSQWVFSPPFGGSNPLSTIQSFPIFIKKSVVRLVKINH